VLVSKRYHDNKGPDYEYDIRGLLTKRTWARGLETVYIYNTLGELTHVDYPNSDTPSVVNTYDRTGRLTSVQDASGTRTYAYANFQLVKEAYTPGMFEDWELHRGYDALRRPDKVDLQHDRVSVHEIEYDYQPHVSRLATVTGHGLTHTYTYQENRNLLSTLDQGGIQSVSWHHDPLS
ncbi:MAG: hypothetical protein P5672_25930, partial [Limnospira sp. PMC 1234.20]|uniref:hypothetical protein n=2 Tax=unclassified Limnospira TaxID=2642885 RepID=UPI0028E181E2